jgi:hypothetical protein
VGVASRIVCVNLLHVYEIAREGNVCTAVFLSPTGGSRVAHRGRPLGEEESCVGYLCLRLSFKSALKADRVDFLLITDSFSLLIACAELASRSSTILPLTFKQRLSYHRIDIGIQPIPEIGVTCDLHLRYAT